MCTVFLKSLFEKADYRKFISIDLLDREKLLEKETLARENKDQELKAVVLELSEMRV